MRRIDTLGTVCSAAGPRLTEAWRTLNQALQTPGGCEADSGLRCEASRAEIRRLSVDCPGLPEVLMANALLAFEARDLVRAQQLLDQLFSLPATYPEAAVLRGRIALEQGNLPFALRFLDQQIRQMGDSGELRETYASALFLSRRYQEALVQLEVAQRLGSPEWRLAYSRGLIEEALGRFPQAKERYEEALRGKPGWKVAESRLRALVAAEKQPAQGK